MMRVLEFGFGETLVIVNRSVANKLHLRHAWDRLEIRVEDRLFRLAGLVVSVAVALRERVEGLSDDVSLDNEIWQLSKSIPWSKHIVPLEKRRHSGRAVRRADKMIRREPWLRDLYIPDKAVS
jgi:hypothetical protein